MRVIKCELNQYRLLWYYVRLAPTEEKRFELLRALPAQLATETASP